MMMMGTFSPLVSRCCRCPRRCERKALLAMSSVAELILCEVPNIEKKRGKKDPDKKPSIVVIQGPKPGKPTDLSRDAVYFPEAETEASATHVPLPPAKDGKDAKGGKDGKDTKDEKDAKDAEGGKDAMEGGKDAKERKDVKNGIHQLRLELQLQAHLFHLPKMLL